jgi:hypothetical protein
MVALVRSAIPATPCGPAVGISVTLPCAACRRGHCDRDQRHAGPALHTDPGVARVALRAACKGSMAVVLVTTRTHARERFANELNQSVNEWFGTVIVVFFVVVVEIIPEPRILSHLITSQFEPGQRGNDPNQYRLTLHVFVTSRHVAGSRAVLNRSDSNAEPRAISQNRRRSALVPLPFPSALFKGIDAEARSSGSRAWRSMPSEGLAVSCPKGTSRS